MWHEGHNMEELRWNRSQGGADYTSLLMTMNEIVPLVWLQVLLSEGVILLQQSLQQAVVIHVL